METGEKMDKIKDKFFKDVEAMIINRNYNQKTINKLIKMITLCQTLSKEKTNKVEIENLLLVATIGEKLVEKFLKLKKR